MTTHASQPRPATTAVRALALAACAVGMLGPGAAAAQQRDSARAGVGGAPADTAAGVQLPQPPISPRRAFVTSLLLPGYGQARLDRPTASAFFFTVEAASALMLAKTARDVRVARRLLADSVPVTFEVDPATGAVRRDSTGAPIVDQWAPGRYPTALLRARRLQREDWIAVLLFNHVLAGAEAFVSAHLWDVPAAVSLTTTGRGGATVVASLRW